MPQIATMVVVTWSANALPKAGWWMDPPVYFGLQLAYYNPSLLELNPYTFPEECIGFYGIEAKESYPETLVCDLCRSKIRYILIVPALPGEAIRKYKDGGINRLTEIAAKSYLVEVVMPQLLAA